MPELAIDDLVVEYTTGGDYKVRPIDGLNLRVDPGKLVILLGPSGCGKTTLLSCLGGILTPTSGSVRFGDVDITGLRGKALTEFRRHTVGIVFQGFNLVASLTALENVMVPLRAAGVDRPEARTRATELLEMVDLGHRMHHKSTDLSGGQQQRVAVARALALDPPLILADEPTAHLDFIQVEELLRLIRRLAMGHRVVVVSTHDSRMIPLADEVVEMMPILEAADDAPFERELEAGETVFRQGDAGDRVFIVEGGRLLVLREQADGTETTLAEIGPGDVFGEMGPFFGLPRTATVRAVAPTTITGYSTRAFREKVGTERLREYLGRAAARHEDGNPTDQ
jgi:putative ABC transport system ATP-binding protein